MEIIKLLNIWLLLFEYVCKDHQYITDIPNLQNGKLLDDKEYLMERAKIVGFEKALVEYFEKYPKKALTSTNTFINNFKAMEGLQKSIHDDLLQTPFNIENFDLEAQGKLKEWAEDPQRKTLVLRFSWREWCCKDTVC